MYKRSCMNPYLESQTFLIAKSVKGHIKKGYLLVDLPPIETFSMNKTWRKSEFRLSYSQKLSYRPFYCRKSPLTISSLDEVIDAMFFDIIHSYSLQRISSYLQVPPFKRYIGCFIVILAQK